MTLRARCCVLFVSFPDRRGMEPNSPHTLISLVDRRALQTISKQLPCVEGCGLALPGASLISFGGLWGVVGRGCVPTDKKLDLYIRNAPRWALNSADLHHEAHDICSLLYIRSNMRPCFGSSFTSTCFCSEALRSPWFRTHASLIRSTRANARRLEDGLLLPPFEFQRHPFATLSSSKTRTSFTSSCVSSY
ncbi:hypothetical protein BDZ89DRAFT_670975 [Hymenopellis radicata]|nr:hypothetical protein BDZ89DRAFT_670975 [Hymenopellis radicata]